VAEREDTGYVKIIFKQYLVCTEFDTILLLISWKWISQTLLTISSLSYVTNPNPEHTHARTHWLPTY